MGGHCSSGYSRGSYSYPEPEVEVEKTSEEQLSEECGVLACSAFLRAMDNEHECEEIVSAVKVASRDLYPRLISGMGTGGITCIDIRSILHVYGFSYFDCRYCSHKRKTSGLPLPGKAVGMVSLKFVDSDASHWMAYREGHFVLPDGDEVDAFARPVTELFPEFDGFGHRFVVWDSEDVQVFRDVYSIPCQAHITPGICNGCFRKSFCLERKYFCKGKIKKPCAKSYGSLCEMSVRADCPNMTISAVRQIIVEDE